MTFSSISPLLIEGKCQPDSEMCREQGCERNKMDEDTPDNRYTQISSKATCSSLKRSGGPSKTSTPESSGNRFRDQDQRKEIRDRMNETTRSPFKRREHILQRNDEEDRRRRSNSQSKTMKIQEGNSVGRNKVKVEDITQVK